MGITRTRPPTLDVPQRTTFAPKREVAQPCVIASGEFEHALAIICAKGGNELLGTRGHWAGCQLQQAMVYKRARIAKGASKNEKSRVLVGVFVGGQPVDFVDGVQHYRWGG